MNENKTIASSIDKDAYWICKIDDWKTSGLSRREYCSRNSLKYPTFNYWYRKLLYSSSQSSATFLEIPFHSKQSDQQTLEAMIELGNLKVNIYSGADPQIAEAIIRGMK